MTPMILTPVAETLHMVRHARCTGCREAASPGLTITHMTTTKTTERVATATAVDSLLAAIESGAGDTVADLYTDDALFDATVPDWRFTLRGGHAIAAQYSEWYADPGHFEELDRVPVPTGEVVTYLLTWEENGVPHAAHQCHLLTLDAATGRIAADVAFCGGRWDAARLASMAEEAEHAD